MLTRTLIASAALLAALAAPAHAATPRAIAAPHTHRASARIADYAPERDQAALGAIATQLTGQPTTVSCDTAASFAAANAADADGYVLWASGIVIATIHLRIPLCRSLETLGLRPGLDRSNAWDAPVDLNPVSGLPEDFPDGWAVSVLGHEAHHISMDSADEAAVECSNVQAAAADVAPFALPAWLATRVIRGEHDHHHALAAPYQNDC